MDRKEIEELLEFSYDEESSSSDTKTTELFFDKNGDKPLKRTSKDEVLTLMTEISKRLDLNDEYSIKRLETAIHNDIPFFAVNRRLIRNWLLENFIY